nr:hypothetical protein CFP56_24017 [Quercus suber]
MSAATMAQRRWCDSRRCFECLSDLDVYQHVTYCTGLPEAVRPCIFIATVSMSCSTSSADLTAQSWRQSVMHSTSRSKAVTSQSKAVVHVLSRDQPAITCQSDLGLLTMTVGGSRREDRCRRWAVGASGRNALPASLGSTPCASFTPCPSHHFLYLYIHIRQHTPTALPLPLPYHCCYHALPDRDSVHASYTASKQTSRISTSIDTNP